MGKKANFSETNRAQIVILHNEEFLGRFAKKMSCSKTAVYQAIPRFKNFGLYHDKKRSGRPRKTSPRDDNLIRKIAVWSPISSCEKISAALLLKGTDIHCTTVNRRLIRRFNVKAFKFSKNLA